MQIFVFFCIFAVFAPTYADRRNANLRNGHCQKKPRSKNCDELGILLYEDLGCTPVYHHRNSCPIKYECKLEPVPGKCLFKDHYYEVDEFIPEELVSIACLAACVCQADGTFMCAVYDCFYPPDPGCYFTYDLVSCCSSGQNCPTDNETITKCRSYNYDYSEGERLYLEDTCDLCICDEKFNTNNPTCERINLVTQIWSYNEISNKCAPVYYDNTILCGPANWICPNGQTIVPLSEPCASKSDLKCQFGNTTVDYGYGFETLLGLSKVRCECKLPPLLTCIAQI